MMGELGVLKPCPFTCLGDDIQALDAVKWHINVLGGLFVFLSEKGMKRTKTFLIWGSRQVRL